MSNPLAIIAPKFGPLKLQLTRNAIAAPTLAASFVGYLPDGPKVVITGGSSMPLGPSFGAIVSDGSILQLTPTKYLGLQYPKGKKVRLTYGLGNSTSRTQALDPQQLIQNAAVGSLNISPVVNNDGPLSLRPHAPKYTWDVSIPDGQTSVDVTVQSQWASKTTELPYRIYGGQPTVAVPSITPASGAYNAAQTITIDCATPSVSIYYTLDGSSPTTSSSLYTGPFQLGESAILSVLAVHDGMFNAPIIQHTYAITIPLEPIIFPPSGTYGAALTCALSSELPGATIYYTVDGTEPTTSSTVYTAPFLVSASTTVKAFATKPGHADSSTTAAVYKLLKWLYNGEGGWTQASAVLIAKNGMWERLV